MTKCNTLIRIILNAGLISDKQKDKVDNKEEQEDTSNNANEEVAETTEGLEEHHTCEWEERTVTLSLVVDPRCNDGVRCPLKFKVCRICSRVEFYLPEK